VPCGYIDRHQAEWRRRNVIRRRTLIERKRQTVGSASFQMALAG
jgi:hypothetical protein